MIRIIIPQSQIEIPTPSPAARREWPRRGGQHDFRMWSKFPFSATRHKYSVTDFEFLPARGICFTRGRGFRCNPQALAMTSAMSNSCTIWLVAGGNMGVGDAPGIGDEKSVGVLADPLGNAPVTGAFEQRRDGAGENTTTERIGRLCPFVNHRRRTGQRTRPLGWATFEFLKTSRRSS